MHTEMWEHPATRGQRRHLRARGVVVIEPAVGRLTGADTGKGRLPDPAEIFAVARRALRRGGRRPTWPAATSWSPPAAPASRSTRCASSATAPPASRATRFARTAVARGRAGDADRGERRRCPTRPASTSCGSAPPRSCARPPSRPRPDADVVVMAAAPADFRPGRSTPTQKIKKTDDGAAPVHRAGHQPRHRRRAGRGQAARSGAGRVRRRDPRRAGERPRRSWPARRADLIVVNEVGVDQVFGADDQRGHHPRRRRQHRGARPNCRRTMWPMRSGTWSSALPRCRRSATLWDGRAPGCRPYRRAVTTLPRERVTFDEPEEHRGTPPVHLRVGHGRPPGQDR